MVLQPALDDTVLPLRQQLIHFGRRVDPQSESYYANLTGFWKGETQFYNLTELDITSEVPSWSGPVNDFLVGANISNATEFADRLGSWNWTRSNRVDLSFGDKLVWSKENKTEVSRDVAMIHVRLFFSLRCLEPANCPSRAKSTLRIQRVQKSSGLSSMAFIL